MGQTHGQQTGWMAAAEIDGHGDSMVQTHWQQTGLMAAAEIDGHGDTCGPIVMEDYLHLARGEPLSIANTDAIRAQMIAAGLMDTSAYRGMTVTSLAAGLHAFYGVQPVKTVAYDANLDTAAFHADLIAAMTAEQLVIMETANGSALPDGQPGVQYHFILMGGIDSTLGYWTCNGDTETALHSRGVTAPIWYTWDDLLASQPVGYIILPKVEVAPVAIIIERDNAGRISGAHDVNDPAQHVGPGFATAIYQAGDMVTDTIVVGESYIGTPAIGYCVISATVMTWTPARGVKVFADSDLAEAVRALHAAQASPALSQAIAGIKSAVASLDRLVSQL